MTSRRSHMGVRDRLKSESKHVYIKLTVTINKSVRLFLVTNSDWTGCPSNFDGFSSGPCERECAAHHEVETCNSTWCWWRHCGYCCLDGHVINHCMCQSFRGKWQEDDTCPVINDLWHDLICFKTLLCFKVPLLDQRSLNGQRVWTEIRSTRLRPWNVVAPGRVKDSPVSVQAVTIHSFTLV